VFIAENSTKDVSNLDAIIFDIDGTLSDVSHRRHFVENGNQQWDLFFKAITGDEPIKPIVNLARLLIRSNEQAVLLVTGRPERTRNDSVEWLLKHGLEVEFDSRLFMRKNGDSRADYVVKREILDDVRKAGFEPVLVFDDRQSVVEMWREQGIRVAQVAPGNF
jgi:phosphoglycolate phosphatase-like HAD superfamily hydrolase